MLNPENPCYGCRVLLPNENSRRAACCWDIDELVVSGRQYQSYFRNRPGVDVISQCVDRWMGEEVTVTIEGPCPQLDTQIGLCTIQNDKPLACRELEPNHDFLCARTGKADGAPFDGRWHLLYSPIRSEEENI